MLPESMLSELWQAAPCAWTLSTAAFPVRLATYCCSNSRAPGNTRKQESHSVRRGWSGHVEIRQVGGHSCQLGNVAQDRFVPKRSWPLCANGVFCELTSLLLPPHLDETLHTLPPAILPTSPRYQCPSQSIGRLNLTAHLDDFRAVINNVREGRGREGARGERLGYGRWYASHPVSTRLAQGKSAVGARRQWSTVVWVVRSLVQSRIQ